MFVQKYSYGGFLNLHKMLSNSNINIIQEIKINNNISNVINKLREFRKYNDNIYEKFINSCSSFVKKLYIETFLDIDKSLAELNELLIKEVKYLLLTNSDAISEASKLNEENFKKNLVDKLYEEFLQQEKSEKDENNLLYFNKINMAQKLRKFLNLYSIGDPEAHEIILSLIQIDTSKITIDHKSILTNFDYILNSPNPYILLKNFVKGDEDIINDSFLKTYWICVKNLHLFFKSYNSHVLTVLGEKFKNDIFTYIDDVICHKKEKVIYNDEASYFLNIYNFFDSFLALLISKVHNSKVTILNENGILISIRINTLSDKLIQLVSTKYYSGTLIPHRLFDDLTYLLVHEELSILKALHNFEVTPIHVINDSSTFFQYKHSPATETIKIASITSQENEEVTKLIKNELEQNSTGQKKEDVKHYKTIADIITKYNGNNPLTQNNIYLLLHDIITGNLTNLSLLFSLEIINYLDEHCEDIDLRKENLRENMQEKEKGDKEKNNEYYNDLGLHLYYSDRLDIQNDDVNNSSTQNLLTNYIHDNPKLKKLYDSIMHSTEYSDSDSNNSELKESKTITEKMHLSKIRSDHSSDHESINLLQNEKKDISSDESHVSKNNDLTLSTYNKSNETFLENLSGPSTNMPTAGSRMRLSKSMSNLSTILKKEKGTSEWENGTNSEGKYKNLSKSMPNLSYIHDKKPFSEWINKNLKENNVDESSNNSNSTSTELLDYTTEDSASSSSTEHLYKGSKEEFLEDNDYSTARDTSLMPNSTSAMVDDPSFTDNQMSDEKHNKYINNSGSSYKQMEGADNTIDDQMNEFHIFRVRNMSNLKVENNNMHKEEEKYEKNMREIMNSAFYLRNICNEKKKIMEIEKLKSIKELKFDLLGTKYSILNKNLLFLNDSNLKNIFESIFFDSNQMKNSIIRIMSTYEIGNLENILDVNISDLNSHFYNLPNVFYNKKKILSLFSLNTSQDVINKIETKLYSVFTIVWVHYTNYLRKILDIFSTKELNVLSAMYYTFINTNKDDHHLNLLNNFGFTDVFLMYTLLISLKRNIYYINQNKSFDIQNDSLLKIQPLQIAHGDNGFYYIFENDFATKILNKNLDNKNKINAGFGLNFYSVKEIDKSIFNHNGDMVSELEEAKMSLPKKNLLTMIGSTEHASVSYNINNKTVTEKYSFLPIYRNENGIIINDVPALITAIICGQLNTLTNINDCIKKEDVFSPFSEKINSIIYNFYNNSTSFKSITFMSNKKAYQNVFSNFYDNEKILLRALILHLEEMSRNAEALSKENEIRYHFSFVYNLIKRQVLKKGVPNHTIAVHLYALEEIIFKYKLYSEKVASTLILLSNKYAENEQFMEVLDIISLIFYRMKVEKMKQSVNQGTPEVHSEILVLDLIDVTNIMAFFNKVLNKIIKIEELEELIDNENIIISHIDEIMVVVRKIFESFDNYFYDIIEDDIRNIIIDTLLKKMKLLLIYYKNFIDDDSKKLSSLLVNNIKNKKSFLMFEGPITYNFPIDISYGKVKNFEKIFFLDLIQYSYSDYTSSHLKYTPDDKDEQSSNMSQLIERVKKVILLYHAFDIPQEYNEKLFQHIFDFAQEESVNKSLVRKSELWGRNVPTDTYAKLCVVNLQRLIRYYFESSRIKHLVDFMLNYDEVKVEIKRPIMEEKRTSSLYSCLKEQWLYKKNFQNMKSYLSNVKMRFSLNVQDIKTCVRKNEGYPHLNTLTNVMLNLLAYELDNIFQTKDKFNSIFLLMGVKRNDMSIKLLYKINNVLNIKQKVAIFYYSKNALLYLTEILSHHFKQKIIYLSENAEGEFSVYSFNPEKSDNDSKIIILKDDHTLKVFDQNNSLFKYEMHHVKDACFLHMYYDEVVNIKEYLESLEGKYAENPRISLEEIHGILRAYNYEMSYTNIQQAILVLLEHKDISSLKKVDLLNLIDLDIVKHRNMRVKNSYLHLLYLEVNSLFAFGYYNNLDNLLNDLFLCDKGLLEWFNESLFHRRKSDEVNNYNKLPLFVTSLRYMIKKLENITSNKLLVKEDYDKVMELFKTKTQEIVKFDFEEVIPLFLKKKKKKKLNYDNTMLSNKVEEFKIDEKIKDKILKEIEEYKFSVSSKDRKPYYLISLIGLGHSYIQKFNKLQLGFHSSMSASSLIKLHKMYNLFLVNELADVMDILISTILKVYRNFFYKNKESIKSQQIKLSKKKRKEFCELILSMHNVHNDLLNCKNAKEEKDDTDVEKNNVESFTLYEDYLNYLYKNVYDFFYSVLNCLDDKSCFLEKEEHIKDVIRRFLKDNPFNEKMVWLIPFISKHFRSSLSILYIKDNDIRLYKYQEDSSIKFSIQILVQDENMFLILPTYFIHLNILNIITNTIIKSEGDISYNIKTLAPLYFNIPNCPLVIDESIKNRAKSNEYYSTYVAIIEEKVSLFLSKKIHIYSLLISIREDILNFKYVIYYEKFVKFLDIMDTFISILNSKIHLNVDITFEDILNSPNSIVENSINNIFSFIENDDYSIFGTEIIRICSNAMKNHSHRKHEAGTFLRLLDFLLKTIKVEIETQNKLLDNLSKVNEINMVKKKTYIQKLKSLESLIICEHVKIISNIMKYVEINLDNIINHIAYKSEKKHIEHEFINKVQIIHDCCLKYDFNELGATELTRKFFNELEKRNIKISDYSKVLQKLSDEEIDYEEWYSIACKIQVDYFKKNELFYIQHLNESTFWKKGAKFFTSKSIVSKLEEQKLYIDEKDIKRLSDNKLTYNEYKDLLYNVKILSRTDNNLDAKLINREHYAISIVWKFINTEICVNGQDIKFEDIYEKLKSHKNDVQYLSLLKKEDVHNLFNAIIIFHRLVEAIDEGTFNKYKSYRITNVLFEELIIRGIYISGDSLLTKEYIETICNYDMWKKDIKQVKVSNMLIRSLVPTKYVTYYSSASIFKILRFIRNSRINTYLVNALSYIIYRILKLGKTKKDMFNTITSEGIFRGSLDAIKLFLIKFNISLDTLITWFTTLLTSMHNVIENSIIEDILESIDYRRIFSNLFFLLHNIVEECYFKAILDFLLGYPFIVEFVNDHEEKVTEILLNFKKLFLLNFGTYINFFLHLYDSIESKFLTYIKYYVTKILNNLLSYSSEIIEKIMQIEIQRISLLEFISFNDEENMALMYENIIAIVQYEDFMNRLRETTVNKHKEYFSNQKKVQVSNSELIHSMYNKMKEHYQLEEPLIKNQDIQGGERDTRNAAVSSFLQKKMLYQLKNRQLENRQLKNLQLKNCRGRYKWHDTNICQGENLDKRKYFSASNKQKNIQPIFDNIRHNKQKLVNMQHNCNTKFGNMDSNMVKNMFSIHRINSMGMAYQKVNGRPARKNQNHNCNNLANNVRNNYTSNGSVRSGSICSGNGCSEKAARYCNVLSNHIKHMNLTNTPKNIFPVLRNSYDDDHLDSSFLENRSINENSNYYLTESYNYRTLSCLEKMFIHIFDANVNSLENKTKTCSSLYTHNWTKKVYKVSLEKLNDKERSIYDYTHDLFLYIKVNDIKCELHFKLNVPVQKKYILSSKKYKNAISDFNIFRENNQLCFIIINSNKRLDKNIHVCYTAELVPFYRTNDLTSYLNKSFRDVDNINNRKIQKENELVHEKNMENIDNMRIYPFNIIDGSGSSANNDSNDTTAYKNNSLALRSEKDSEMKNESISTLQEENYKKNGKELVNRRNYSKLAYAKSNNLRSGTLKNVNDNKKKKLKNPFKKIKKGINKIKYKIKERRKSAEKKDNLNNNIEKIQDALKYITNKKVINHLLEFEYFHSGKWSTTTFSLTIDTMKGTNENIKLILELGDYNIKTYYEVDLNGINNIPSLQKLDAFIKKSNIRNGISQRLKKYTKLNMILKYLFKFNHEIKHVSYVKWVKQVPMKNDYEQMGKMDSITMQRDDQRQKMTQEKSGNLDSGAEEQMMNKDNKDKKEKHTIEEYLKFTWYKEHNKRREEAIISVRSINPFNLKNHNSEILCEVNGDITDIFTIFETYSSRKKASSRKETDLANGDKEEKEEDKGDQISEKKEEEKIEVKGVDATNPSATHEIRGMRMKSTNINGRNSKYFSDYAKYFSKIYSLTEEENYFIKTRMDKTCALLKYRLILLSVIIIKSNNLSNLKKMNSLSNELLTNRYKFYKHIEYHQNKLFRKRHVYVENKHYIIKKKLECLIGLEFYKSLKNSLERKKILNNFLEDLAVEISSINKHFYKYYYTDNTNIHSSNFYLDNLKNIKSLCPIIYELKNKEKFNFSNTSKVDSSVKIPTTTDAEKKIKKCEKKVGFYGSTISFFGKVIDESIGKTRIKNIAMFSYQCEKSIFNGKNLSELDDYYKNFCINIFDKEIEELDEPFKPNTEWINMLYNTFSSNKNHNNYGGNNYSEIKCFGFADRDELKAYEKKKGAKCKITILNRTLNVLQQFIDKYYKLKEDGISNGNAYNIYALFKNIYIVMIYKLMFETRAFKPLRIQQKLNLVGNKYTKLLYKKENYSKYLSYMLDKISTLYLEIEFLYRDHVFLRNISFPSDAVEILMFLHKPFSDDAYGYKLSADPNKAINEGEQNTRVYAFFVLNLLGYYPEIQKVLLEASQNVEFIYKLLDIDVIEMKKILESKEEASSENGGSSNTQKNEQKQKDSSEKNQTGIADKITKPFGTIYNYLFSRGEDEGDYNSSSVYATESMEKSKMNDIKYEINDFKWMEKEQIYSIKKLIVQHELVDYFVKGIKLMNLQSYLNDNNYLVAYKKALNEELKKKDFHHHFIKTTPPFNFDTYKVHHLLLFAFYYGFSDIIRTRRQYVNLETTINRTIDNNKSIYVYRTKSYNTFNLDPEKRGTLNKEHEEIAKLVYKYAIQYRFYHKDDINNNGGNNDSGSDDTNDSTNNRSNVFFKFNKKQKNELISMLKSKNKKAYTPRDLDEIISFIQIMVENYIFILNNYPSNFSLSKRSSFYDNFIKNVKQFFFSFNKKNNLIYIINQKDINYNMQAIKQISDKSTAINLIKSIIDFILFAATRSYNVDYAIKNVISINNNDDISLKNIPKKSCSTSNCRNRKFKEGYIFLEGPLTMYNYNKKSRKRTENYSKMNPSMEKVHYYHSLGYNPFGAHDSVNTKRIGTVSRRTNNHCKCYNKYIPVELWGYKNVDTRRCRKFVPLLKGGKMSRYTYPLGINTERKKRNMVICKNRVNTFKNIDWYNSSNTISDKKKGGTVEVRKSCSEKCNKPNWSKRGNYDSPAFYQIRNEKDMLSNHSIINKGNLSISFIPEDAGKPNYIRNGTLRNRVNNNNIIKGEEEGAPMSSEITIKETTNPIEIIKNVPYNFIENEHKNNIQSSDMLSNFLGTQMSNLYSKLKGGVFSFTFVHGFDFFLRNSLFFYRRHMISKYITYYTKMNVIQSLDMLFLIVRNVELNTSLTNTDSMKHSLFDICLCNMQNLSVSLKNILNVIDEEKLEKLLSNIIAVIHMRYTGNARFIEDLVNNINEALSKNITLKKLFGNFISYLTISSIQTVELYFHSRYKKKLLSIIITFLNKISATVSNIFGEPFFQSYVCTHLIKIGESFIQEFNAENTVYRFFMDIGEINFIDIIVSYAYNYLPKAVRDFTEK
ncbi:conserved Plasmodium protein, unknown function [Plasmodium malariae]|uniref:Uncharacterized protein n=1 Tax=Plasmodium malariae TaxID=5858 RepID=A0A1D3PBZ5_PLAMA|nr:conserved Plasmodium protein, unknown function [Plasmodium malariae]SCN12651.1 conserved Plasmodium protein, unknown function [Plasmodium malariae]